MNILALALTCICLQGGAFVSYIVDGDTLALRNGERVRIAGIDTPERSECGYGEAAAALRSLVRGHAVFLGNRSGDRVDRYGRLLRYVHDNQRDVGLALIRAGMAESYTAYPHDRTAQYERAEAQARQQQRGLWRACGHP